MTNHFLQFVTSDLLKQDFWVVPFRPENVLGSDASGDVRLITRFITTVVKCSVLVEDVRWEGKTWKYFRNSVGLQPGMFLHFYVEELKKVCVQVFDSVGCEKYSIEDKRYLGAHTNSCIIPLTDTRMDKVVFPPEYSTFLSSDMFQNDDAEDIYIYTSKGVYVVDAENHRLLNGPNIHLSNRVWKHFCRSHLRELNEAEFILFWYYGFQDFTVCLFGKTGNYVPISIPMFDD